MLHNSYAGVLYLVDFTINMPNILTFIQLLIMRHVDCNLFRMVYLGNEMKMFKIVDKANQHLQLDNNTLIQSTLIFNIPRNLT